MKIIIYTTPTCVYCRMTKEFLDKRGVSYIERNVIEDESAREEMINKSHQLGVPVIDIDGEIFVGFNRSELESLLKSNQSLSSKKI
ncbi:glutaredoxin family protein [Candidatus Jorgensenbacteria bacterium]|nr:glutaredoxin family protein [Candidatus Jorgensenbacteria bacterium]